LSEGVFIFGSSKSFLLKIAILADALDDQYAGVHYYTRQLVEALDRQNESHSILLLRPMAGTEKWKTCETLVLPKLNFPGAQAWRFFVQIPAALRRWKPDVVIEPGHFGPFNLPGGVKRATIIHDLTPLLFPEMHRWHSQMLQKIFLPSILKRAHYIFTNSEYTRRDLIRYFPGTEAKTHVLLPGKEPGFEKKTDPAVLKKYGIGQLYLLFVGTFEPRKNLPVLIEAFARFKECGFPHQLVLVGKKGWHYAAIEAALAESPFREQIIVPGYVERADLPVLFTMAQAFVYPSQYEGFGLPVLESMICGTPVITTDVSSLPEVAGAAALYAKPGDVESLTAQMIFIASNDSLRQKLAQAGNAQAKSFDWDKTARNMIDVLMC